MTTTTPLTARTLSFQQVSDGKWISDCGTVRVEKSQPRAWNGAPLSSRPVFQVHGAGFTGDSFSLRAEAYKAISTALDRPLVRKPAKAHNAYITPGPFQGRGLCDCGQAIAAAIHNPPAAAAA